MSRRFTSIISIILCGILMIAVTGCKAKKKVTVTFNNGDVALGSVEVKEGEVLAKDSYAGFETVKDAEFKGWFKTPTYLDASKVNLSSDTFSEDTVLYGCFQSNKVTEDSRVWYLAGTSTKGPLKQSNWAAEATDDVKDQLMLKPTGNKTNEFAITIDLYKGDQFQLVHDWQWDGQLGYGYVTEADSTQFENGGGLSGETKKSNINVAMDGNYTITLVTNPEDEALTTLTIVRNKDAAPVADEKEDAKENEKEGYTVTENTKVRVKGSWVPDWSEYKDLDKISDGVYEITMDLKKDTELYFSIFEGDKDSGLGLKAENIKDDASKAFLEKSDNVKVAKDGSYIFTIDLNNNTIQVKQEGYAFTENTKVRVKGSWVSDWSEFKDLNKISDGIYEITMDLKKGTELYFSIFEGDKDSGLGLKGKNVKDDASKALLEASDNVKVANDGSYTFTVNLNKNTIQVKQ